MSHLLDATGKTCPMPVILARKALKEQGSDLTVLVDNPTAVENLKRLAGSEGLTAAVTESGGTYAVSFSGTPAPASWRPRWA